MVAALFGLNRADGEMLVVDGHDAVPCGSGTPPSAVVSKEGEVKGDSESDREAEDETICGLCSGENWVRWRVLSQT